MRRVLELFARDIIKLILNNYHTVSCDAQQPGLECRNVTARRWLGFTVLASVFCCWSDRHCVRAQTPPRCVLAGAVLNSETKAGIPHAMVSFMGAASGYRFTDAGGNFEVDNVPCKSYSLAVSKPGFVSGQERSSQLGAMFGPGGDATPEESQDAGPSPLNINLELKPGVPPARIELIPVSAITGTVTDENDEPIAGVTVQAISVKMSLSGTGSGTEYVPIQTAHTDDRGRYALLGLTPGDFLVRLAGEGSSTRYFVGSTLNPNNDHRGLPPVYYPNGDSVSSASVFHLLPGERASADFRQATEPAFDINGRLAGFLPQCYTQIQLYRDGDRIPVGRAFVNLSSGQFRMTDIPAGSYTLRASQYQADPPRWLAGEEPVTIAAEPVRNFVLELSSAVDIPVSVSYEAGAQPGAVVQVVLQPQHARENVRRLLIGRHADAPEKLGDVIPDKYKLSAQMLSIPSNSGYVASAKLGDVEVLHGEFTLSGSNAGELHVTVRGDGATVQGQVTLAGEPAPGAQVFLIPASSDGARLLPGFSDEQGHYEIKGLAPGDYRIQAWKGIPAPEQVLSEQGQTLSLEAGEQRTVALEAKPGANRLE